MNAVFTLSPPKQAVSLCAAKSKVWYRGDLDCTHCLCCSREGQEIWISLGAGVRVLLRGQSGGNQDVPVSGGVRAAWLCWLWAYSWKTKVRSSVLLLCTSFSAALLIIAVDNITWKDGHLLFWTRIPIKWAFWILHLIDMFLLRVTWIICGVRRMVYCRVIVQTDALKEACREFCP